METPVALFRGGPHHNEVWSVPELLYGHPERPTCATWITDYSWTKDTVVGSETGRMARVWMYLHNDV